ncbi:MAG: POTRA domain-containing protein, partial [Thermodesulfovibrionales bacterium]
MEVEGLYSIKKEELLYLLDISKGEELNPDKITIGIKRAFLKGIFDDIRVYHEGNGRLKIDAKERDIVETISIEGNSYLPDRIIRKYIATLPFKEGQIMRYDLLDKLREHLIMSLSEKGFPNCKVESNVINTGKPHRVKLLIRIEENEPVRIKRLTIIGDESVRKLMGLEEGDIFDKDELLKGFERIKRYYKKEGRTNFVIGPYTFSEGELSIHINPGKKLDISFYGNETISSKTLMKELPFVEFENFRDEMLEEAVSNLKSLYHKKGFLNPQIAPVISEDSENINLSFYIFEGRKVKIKSIKFSGITLREKNLREIMTTKEGEFLNPEALSYDRDIIS